MQRTTVLSTLLPAVLTGTTGYCLLSDNQMAPCMACYCVGTYLGNALHSPCRTQVATKAFRFQPNPGLPRPQLITPQKQKCKVVNTGF